MNEAMVTARMSCGKKEEGTSVLRELGTTPSKAINDLFDYVVRHRSLPFEDGQAPASSISREEVHAALNWLDGISLPEGNRFAGMSDGDIKAERLVARGMLEALHD